MGTPEWGRSEFVTKLTPEEIKNQDKLENTTAFTKEAFDQLMNWFDGSDPIGEELWNRFKQINEQLNKDKVETSSYASNESINLADSMEINRTDIETAKCLSLTQYNCAIQNLNWLFEKQQQNKAA